uniref:Uncharacterized protein n=1 Tax=Oryza sativa subsp. japonica TaxID=39947 RepID=Q6Z0U7_ORYSJ|nr:hypothetical protein [Oryza sativa Japonica Group]
MSRLRDIIIWGYILRMRGGPLMVTAQYGYSFAPCMTGFNLPKNFKENPEAFFRSVRP